MKHIKISGWGLLSLLAALSLAPLSASARDNHENLRAEPSASAPIARTKPVVDQVHAHREMLRRQHAAHHHHGAQAQH